MLVGAVSSQPHGDPVGAYSEWKKVEEDCRSALLLDHDNPKVRGVHMIHTRSMFSESSATCVG